MSLYRNPFVSNGVSTKCKKKKKTEAYRKIVTGQDYIRLDSVAWHSETGTGDTQQESNVPLYFVMSLIFLLFYPSDTFTFRIRCMAKCGYMKSLYHWTILFWSTETNFKHIDWTVLKLEINVIVMIVPIKLLEICYCSLVCTDPCMSWNEDLMFSNFLQYLFSISFICIKWAKAERDSWKMLRVQNVAKWISIGHTPMLS